MRKFWSLAATVAALGFVNVAHAQEDYTPVNISVRAGVALPLDSSLSDFGSPLLALGVEYQLPRPLLSQGDSYVSLDYMTANTLFSHGVVPFCLNQRFYLSNAKLGRRTYAFLGVGGAVIDIDHSGVGLAARGGFGADLGDAIFFEVAGLITDKISGATADSVAFYLGYRF
ncbi:MAG TPA: hypothetical protein VG944_22400 [Fimbriimonas sp.]|nr:hypothetical protein [Fimbriimonas sp.]